MRFKVDGLAATAGFGSGKARKPRAAAQLNKRSSRKVSTASFAELSDSDDGGMRDGDDAMAD